ncbi:thiamine biosynthesis protein ApbE [Duganella sp. Leaf126]|uniref:FAD:protein FMN transferase n=1 Tax=Duganella sp. Leaf126 TaxID=1736266 RepID=UPI0006FAC3B6|nr:FAD:protein FMN transferase [Duganella sp. Leaf126]KQQ32604.1 thiamine biosynthesis protein ApbE [Duganella sp. Leaf126]
MVTAIHRQRFDAMGSSCELRLSAPNAAAAEALAARAIAEVRRIETKYSRYRPDSIVSRINAAAGQAPVACDSETMALIDYAAALFSASGGLFDITSGVLRRAWDFRQPRVPDADTLGPLLALVGWRHVQCDRQQVQLMQAGMELDFGGFGKEYAADRAAAVLIEAGVHHGYVNLGGDMRFIGPRPDGQPWQIGIQDPRNPQATVASIPISCGALTTSGDYERYFDLDGVRYCHILDPRTGMPVRYWRSVSVMAPMAVAAGSCSTIAMLKQQEGHTFLKTSDMGYLAIDEHGQTLYRNL